MYEGKILLRIYDDFVDIEDRWGLGYGWLYEVDSDFLVTDIFEYGGRRVSVKDAKEPEMESEKNTIDKYNVAIEYLSKNPITNYTYFSSEPEVHLNNFEDVMKTVINRKPIIF